MPHQQRARAERALHPPLLPQVQSGYRLLQVTHAAMDQFGGSTRSGRGEIPAVYEDRLQPAQLRVQRAARARGPTADDADVERLARDVLQRFRTAFHRVLISVWFWLCTKSIDTWKRGVAVLAAALAAG